MNSVALGLDVQTFNKNKLIDANPQQNITPAITLDSVDIKEEVVDTLFEEAVKENIANGQSASSAPIDKKTARALRKNDKKARKEQASQKAQVVYKIVLPKIVQLKGEDILTLRFSQDSIDGKTGDGSMTLEQLANNMETKGWKKGSQITVIHMPDGKYISADNRRLHAAKKVAQLNKEFALTANIYQYSDKAPKNLIKGVEAEYRKAHELDKTADISKLILTQPIEAETYGYVMLLRINTRQGDLAHSHFGYEQDPVVRS